VRIALEKQRLFDSFLGKTSMVWSGSANYRRMVEGDGEQMRREFARNTDLESVRPAELDSAEPEAPDMDVRWPHRQHACVPITRVAPTDN